MTTPRAREAVGWPLFLVGLAIMLVEYGLHVWGHLRGAEYRIGLAPIGIGAVFTFIGWYWLSPKGAKDGGRFILDGFMGVISTIRNGRRATDAAVVVQAQPVAPAPAVNPPGPPSGRGE